MKANQEFEIIGDIYKRKRSISSKIGNNINEENNCSKGKKSRHRKMASSYFLGSYISGDELNKFLQEYKGINNDYNMNNFNNNYNNIKDNGIPQNNTNDEAKEAVNLLKNHLLNDKKEKIDSNNENNNNKEKIMPATNSSFYSYSVEDENEKKNEEKEENGSMIIKGGGEGGDESLTNNCETKSNSYFNNTNNNPFYELEKNNEKFNKDKSFIPIKNGLKYLKDKEERVTESYLMALNGGDINEKNGKNQYLPTTSIIEEEKSEFIESTSKKQSIIKGTKFVKDVNFKKKKIENEFDLVKNNEDILENSNEDENKENIDNNIKNKDRDIYEDTTVKKLPKLDFDLNKIKNKNNDKEEKRRRCLRKNKENLLNSFYNLSCNKIIPSPSAINNINNICIQKKVGNQNCNSFIYNQILAKNNKMIINNHANNEKIKELIKSSSKSLIQLPPYISKKKRNFSYSGGYISYLYRQRFNTENSLQKNEKMKYNNSNSIYQKNDKNIIYHIYSNNCKEINKKKKLNKSMNTPIIPITKINPKTKIPHKKFDKSLIKTSNYEIINKKNRIKFNKVDKIFLDLNHRRSMSISREKIEDKIIHKNFTNFGEKNYICEESLRFFNLKPNLDSSRIINQRKKKGNNTKNCNIPTHSDSLSCRTKEKIRDKIINNKKAKRKCFMRKANSGLFKTRFVSEMENKNDFEINISNKKQTLIILKEKIIFSKSYEKNDVLEKINKTLNCNKSSFIILCDNKYSDIFVFNGLFKYYENQKRFIKIYGNEKVPNVILTKNINNTNYKIYENKIIQDEENKTQFFFDQIDSFYFSFNSIIICKK